MCSESDESKSADFRFNPLQEKNSLKMTRLWMDSHLGELEMWIHRFIGKPSQIKEFEDTGT